MVPQDPSFKGNPWLSAEGATHPAKRDDNPLDPSFIVIKNLIKTSFYFFKIIIQKKKEGS